MHEIQSIKCITGHCNMWKSSSSSHGAVYVAFSEKNKTKNKQTSTKQKTLNVLLFVPLCHPYQNANASNLTLA